VFIRGKKMVFWEIHLSAGLVILGSISLLWLASLLLRDASIVDVFWGIGFIIACWFYFSRTPDGYLARKLLLSSLVTIWGLRLSLHILIRNWGKQEDFRYANWRRAAGSKWWWQSYFKVFLLQGALLWLISAPLLAAQASPTPDRLTILDYLALVIWAIGFYFEAVGDWQLARFKADPANRGKLLISGVWRYTRHPNYFGDAAQWWGYYLFALSAGGWWTIFSPLLMTYLLLRVSGVAMLERTLADSKPGYREYMQTTSAFVPWFPQRSKP
jgi:steroid 5-alpha reductase family enzyme